MISVAAELTGMRLGPSRFDREGLVNPAGRGNTRLYSRADIDQLNLVAKLTDEDAQPCRKCRAYSRHVRRRCCREGR